MTAAPRAAKPRIPDHWIPCPECDGCGEHILTPAGMGRGGPCDYTAPCPHCHGMAWVEPPEPDEDE